MNNDKPKSVKGLPPPPPVTPEMIREVHEQGIAWSKHYAKIVRGMTFLTGEDWATRVK